MEGRRRRSTMASNLEDVGQPLLFLHGCEVRLSTSTSMAAQIVFTPKLDSINRSRTPEEQEQRQELNIDG
jgi:hypothetical protein